MADAWTQRFAVRSYETEPGGRLSLTGLCNYLQEAAGAHAVDLGISIGDLGRDNLTWVLGRLELRIERMPRWREVVDVTTWPSRLRSLLVLRDFLVESAEREVLARATSTWFVIDLERRRPVRIPAHIRGLPLPRRPRALRPDGLRLPRPARVDREERFRVRHRDLDVNAHVNHVRYVEWALDTLPGSFLDGHRLTELDADFRAEVVYGETVRAQAEVDGGGEESRVCFRLLRGADAGDGADEAARIRTRWLLL